MTDGDVDDEDDGQTTRMLDGNGDNAKMTMDDGPGRQRAEMKITDGVTDGDDKDDDEGDGRRRRMVDVGVRRTRRLKPLRMN